MEYCSISRPGEFCGNVSCPNHIAHAPCGCAVTVCDQSRECGQFQLRLKVKANSFTDGCDKIRELKAEHEDMTADEILGHTEFIGLTAKTVAEIVKNFE